MYPYLYRHGNVAIPSYFVIIGLGYIVGLYLTYFRAKKLDLSPRIGLDVCFVIMITGFIGGRLLHVFYEFPAYYWEDPDRIFEIWKGGFVFYGGVILAFPSVVTFLKWRRQDLELWYDLFAPIIPVVYGIGRIADFCSGSCYGTQTNLPWAVVYPPGVEAPTGIPLHPAPIYELMWSIVSVIILVWLERRRDKLKSIPRIFLPVGSLFGLMMILHGAGRIMMEHFRGDYRGALIMGFTISTWISSLIVVLGFIKLWAGLQRAPKLPRLDS